MAKNILIKDLIRQIHTELIESQQERESKGTPTLFEVKKLTIEAHFVVSDEREVETGIGLSLIKAGLNGNYKNEEVHKITLELGVTNSNPNDNGPGGNAQKETTSEELEEYEFDQPNKGINPLSMPEVNDIFDAGIIMPAEDEKKNKTKFH